MTNLKRKRLLLYLVTFFYWFAQYVYNPYMTPYLLGLNISASFAGVIVGMYGSTQLLCRLPLGLAADNKQKHKLFILLGALLSATASLIRVLSQNPYVLLSANAISGVASSMWISFTILNSLYYEPHELSRSIGSINAVNNVGILAAYLLGGLFYQRFGMVLMFWMSLISGAIATVLALFIVDEPPKPNPLPVRQLLRVVGQRRLIVYSLLAALFQFIVFATSNSFSNTVIQNIGVTSIQLSICSALFTFAGVLSSYFVGTKRAAVIGETRLAVIGFSLLALYCFLLPQMKSFFGMTVMQFLGGCGGTSVFSLIMSAAIRDVPDEQRSTAMGFFQSVYAIGIMAGPSVMGTLIDWFRITPAFSIVGIVCVLTAAAYPLISRFMRRAA